MVSDLEQHTSGTTQGGFASVCGTSALNDDDGVTGGKAPGSVVDPRYEFAAPQWFDFTAEREREDEERRGVGPERRSVGDRWFDEDHGRKPGMFPVRTWEYIFLVACPFFRIDGSKSLTQCFRVFVIVPVAQPCKRRNRRLCDRRI